MSGVEFSLAGGAGGPFDTMADLGRYLDAVAGAGFTGVSLGLEQLPAAATRPGAVAEVARLVRAAGLTCPDIHALVVGPDDAATLATAARLATIAEAVRARHVLTVLHTPVSAASLDRLGRCARMIAGAGATLAVEFAPTRPLDSIAAAREAVEHIGPESAGVLIDTWHFFRGPSTWRDLEEMPLTRLAYVQFDDALPARSGDFLTETTLRRTWPGQGTFDLDRFVRTLTSRSWDGLVSVEVLSGELRRLDVATFANQAYRSTRRYWPAGP